MYGYSFYANTYCYTRCVKGWRDDYMNDLLWLPRDEFICWKDDRFGLLPYRLYLAFRFDIFGRENGIEPERYIEELRYVIIFNFWAMALIYDF